MGEEEEAEEQQTWESAGCTEVRKANCMFVLIEFQRPPIPAPLIVCIHGLNGCISSFESVASKPETS